ncbi:MAG: FecR domain-containing protein [Gemmatimonadaceae bacterium]
MPVTSQPTDQPMGLVIPDEPALERLFRAQYSALLAEAKTKLPGAEVAAPRVVSKAFHLAWNDRARFRTQEELAVFLRSAIQHGAVRELSRRAGLHRADHAIAGTSDTGETPITHHDIVEMTLDEAWDRLKHTLHGGAPEAFRQRASAARHEAAEHMAALGKERSWKPLLIFGGLALVGVLALVLIMDRQSADVGIRGALAASNARTHETGYGQFVRITLDDSTIVTLAPQSKLTVPRDFNISLRAVGVEGAANFEVSQVQETPFQVRAGAAAILAHGTTFTVRRFPGDPAVIVHAREGKIELRVANARRELNAGMSYSVTDSGAVRVPSGEELNEASNWVDGNITIAGRTLRYVLPELRRWFGLDIKVVDNVLLERTVFVRAPIGSQREAINSVEKSAGLKFTYVGENMTFTDTISSRPAGRR